MIAGCRDVYGFPSWALQHQLEVEEHHQGYTPADKVTSRTFEKMHQPCEEPEACHHHNNP